MSNSKWISPIRDGEIIKFLRSLQKKHPSLAAHINIPGQQVVIFPNPSDVELVNALLLANGYTIASASLNLGGLSCNYSNAHQQLTPFSRIELNVNSNTVTSPGQTAALIEISRFFAPNAANTQPADSELQSQRLLQIETYLTGAVERFEELQSSFARKNQELRDQHEAAVAEIRKQQEQEHSVHLEAINEKELELRKARKDLDDRNNTHVRREIRKDIKSEIAEALEAQNSSRNVDDKRKWLRIVYLLILAACATSAGLSLYSFNLAIATSNLNVTALWFAAIKATITSLSFVGLGLLYLRWENSWLSQQSKFELTLAATKVDIDRASWIAESLLEWNRETPNSPIPPELLQSFSRRLFDWDAKIDDYHTASDSLASAILGSAAKLQIGPAGANVEIDRKGIKSLSKPDQ